MSTENQKICTECNFEMVKMLREHSLTHLLVLWYCPRCKHKEKGGLVEGHVHEEPEFSLIISWAEDKPNTNEISAIFKMDKSLKDKPMKQLLLVMRASNSWTLSELSKNELDEYLEICDEFELNYTIN